MRDYVYLSCSNKIRCQNESICPTEANTHAWNEKSFNCWVFHWNCLYSIWSMLWRYVTIIRPMCESKTLCCFFVVIILKLISFSSQSIHCAHINCEERAQLDDASIISSLVKFLSEHVNGVVSVRFYLFSPIVPPKWNIVSETATSYS